MAVQSDEIQGLLLQTQRAELEAWFDQRLAERFATQMEQFRAHETPKMTIMVTKGALDWAYPPFIIASTAAALGWEVTMFFTFYGLALLKKDLKLAMSPLGNPAMPMKMPFGPQWFQDVEWKMPNLIMAGIPGFQRFATSMMKKTIKNKGVAPVEELRALCLEAEVHMIACQMTMDLFGWKREDFIDGIEEWAGAATYIDNVRSAHATLFI